MVIMIFAVVKPYIQTPSVRFWLIVAYIRRSAGQKGGLSAELCLSVSQKPNWKTHTLNNFLSFFSFFRCSHSRCVQGSREDDDIFGGAGVWCRAVVLCSPHLLPQDTCNPLAVLSLMWTFWWILARTVQSGLWCHFLWVDFFFSTIKRKAMCKLMECTLYSTECSRC